jgi:iron complex outermembrane receptor protein
LAFALADLLLIRSQIARREGRHWHAAWLQLRCRQAAGSAASATSSAASTASGSSTASAANRGGAAFQVSLSLFFNRVADFILIESGVPRAGGPGPARTVTVARGVDAASRGGEAAFSWALGGPWSLEGSLACTRGENRTQGRPLPQVPPLEARLGLVREGASWSLGGLARAAARQDRVAPGQGNVAGQDLGPAGGFATLGLHGAWRSPRGLRLGAGVDNLLDRSYAEHLNRAATRIPGFEPPAGRVPEPGRFIWVKLGWAFRSPGPGPGPGPGAAP